MQDLLNEALAFPPPHRSHHSPVRWCHCPKAGWWVVQKESWEHALRAPRPLVNNNLGGGNSNIFYVHPYLGKIPILTHIFSDGLVQPPTIVIMIVVAAVVVVVFDPLLPTEPWKKWRSLSRRSFCFHSQNFHLKQKGEWQITEVNPFLCQDLKTENVKIYDFVTLFESIVIESFSVWICGTIQQNHLVNLMNLVTFNFSSYCWKKSCKPWYIIYI